MSYGPSRITSPVSSSRWVTRAPLTRVPWSVPRSRTEARVGVRTIMQCDPPIPRPASTRSHPAPDPMNSGPCSGENVWAGPLGGRTVRCRGIRRSAPIVLSWQAVCGVMGTRRFARPLGCRPSGAGRTARPRSRPIPVRPMQARNGVERTPRTQRVERLLLVPRPPGGVRRRA